MASLAGMVGRLPPSVRRILKAIPGATKVRDRVYGSPSGERYPSGSHRPIVYLPTWLEWNVMRQRPQYLLEALAESGHDIFFVDPRHIGDDVQLGRVTITSSLSKTPASGVILYTHFAPTRTLIDRYESAVVIYDILDDLTIYDADEVGMPEERTVRHHHGPLMETADLVIASNEVLVERHRDERPDVVLVENGVDTDLFTPEGDRVELGDSPVIGLHAAIREWVDLELIAGCARSRPEYTFVLVGPANDAVRDRMAGLAGLPNVRVFPEQTSDRVAAFVRSFTVGTVPFVLNELTEGVTPIKAFEYLASGLPVVATPLPWSAAYPAILVADGIDEWLSAIDIAVEFHPQGRHAMRALGLGASWQRRIEPLLARLESLGLRYVP